MRQSTVIPGAAQSVDILLFDRFSNHCLANTLEPLRAANTISNQALYRWRILSPAALSVCSSSGLEILADVTLAAIEDNAANKELASYSDRLLVLMASYGYRQHDNRRLRAVLNRAARRYTTVIGLDTGAWLLAAAGLLNGKSATIHRDVLGLFADAFPAVRSTDERFVIDGRLITCGGAMAAFDLILHLIGRQHGELLRLDVAAMFLKTQAEWCDNGDAQSALEVGPSFAPPRRPVVRAMTLMREHLMTPLPISALAAHLHCSQKSLERYFNASIGKSPSQVYRRLRLAAIRQQLEDSDRRIAEIALDYGYDNASAMTRAFVDEFGLTPTALRQRRNRV